MPTKATNPEGILELVQGLTVTQSLLLLLLLVPFVPLCKADRFYCMRSGLSKIQLDYERRNEHSIVPEFDSSEDLSVGQRGEIYIRECTWKFYHVSQRTTNIILEGINRGILIDVRLQKRSIQTGAATTAAQVHYHIRYTRIPSCASKYQSAFVDFTGNLTAQTVRVIPLQPGEELIVTIERHEHFKSPVAFRVTAVDEGYCTRLTTLHRKSCHYVTKDGLTLDKTADFIQQSSGTTMQLASFENWKDILSFINSNKPKDDEFPIKLPLDLTRPVRIGLFSTLNGYLKRMVTNGNKCTLEVLRNAEEILVQLSTGKSCISLKVEDSGSPVIELVDCNQPMPALISFPETPWNDSCLDCSWESLGWLNENSPTVNNDKPPLLVNTEANRTSQISYNADQSLAKIIVITSIVAFVFIVIVIGTVLVVYSRRRHSSNEIAIFLVSIPPSQNTTLSRDAVFYYSDTLDRSHEDPLIYAGLSGREDHDTLHRHENEMHVYAPPESII